MLSFLALSVTNLLTRADGDHIPLDIAKSAVETRSSQILADTFQSCHKSERNSLK